MRTRIECDRNDWRLAEMGIMFICPDRRCPLHSECPYAARTNSACGELERFKKDALWTIWPISRKGAAK